MKIFEIMDTARLSEKAKNLFLEERSEKKVLNGWFLSREIAADATEGKTPDKEEKAVLELEAVIEMLPLEISDYAVFAGTADSCKKAKGYADH